MKDVQSSQCAAMAINLVLKPILGQVQPERHELQQLGGELLHGTVVLVPGCCQCSRVVGQDGRDHAGGWVVGPNVEALLQVGSLGAERGGE